MIRPLLLYRSIFLVSVCCPDQHEQGYEVHGIIRRSSSFNTQRIDHIYRDRHESAVRLKLHYGDLTDSTNLMHIIYEVSMKMMGSALHAQHFFRRVQRS